LLATLAGVGYVVLADHLFHGRAGNIDEIVTRWQAMLLLDGRFVMPLPAHPESVLVRYTGIGPFGLIGQFPIGTVLAMLPFVALGVHWITGAVWGGIGLFCWARLVRRLEPHAPTALGAVLLLAISPFYAGQSASQLGHVPVLALMLAAGLALSHLFAADGHVGRSALLLGLAIGAAAMVRPLEGLVAATPAALIVLWQVARRRLPARVVLLGLVGVAGPIAVLLGSNVAQTGKPLQFGYEQVWGAAHRPGFHEAPRGRAHTPERGLRQVRGYLRSLDEVAWGGPVRALAPAVVAMLLGAMAIGLIDGWLLLTGAALLAGYWAYWARGDGVGPRFVLPLMPLLALWTARLPRLVGRFRPELAVLAGVLLTINVGWGLARFAPGWFHNVAATERAAVADVASVLDTVPPVGLVIVDDDRRRAAASRLRVLGVNASSARRLATENNWCEMGWRVRSLEVGDSVPGAAPPAWIGWCADSLTARDVRGDRDASGAILLGSTPTRPVVRDLGARTALLADSVTLRHRTVRVVWESKGRRVWPRLARFDYDSALAAWAREDAAFVAARREVGR
jgi:hypothetical protein